MIPAGREAIDGAGAAMVLQMRPQTFRKKGLASSAGFPRPFRQGARKPLWDRAQVEAFALGKQLPELPAGSDPDDLLDGPEAAGLLGVDYATLRKYVSERRMTAVEVCGVPHFRRADVEFRKANPGRPGRPSARETGS